VLRRIPYQQLSLFCGNLATCLAAGLSVPVSLRTSMRSSPSLALREAAETAAQRAAGGMELAEALEVGRDFFPPFLLPVIRCGERSGRLDEALRYLEHHCALLDGPSRMMRNTWLAPLVIMIAGSVIKTLAHAILAPLAMTLGYAMRSLADYALLGAAAWLLFGTPQGKRLLDHLKLALPVIAQVERDLAMNRTPERRPEAIRESNRQLPGAS